jgi:hypothetical protein
MLFISTVPGVSNQNFYKGGAVGVIYALDQNTGDVIWSFDTVDSKVRAKEQPYIYDTEKINAVMNEDEQIKLNIKVVEYSQRQADPGFLIPFILYNLLSEGRAYMAQTMPSVVTQELLPGAWQEKWAPMKPFFLD